MIAESLQCWKTRRVATNSIKSDYWNALNNNGQQVVEICEVPQLMANGSEENKDMDVGGKHYSKIW